jgi:hypothetical protein
MSNFGHYQTADTVHVVYPDGDAAVTISRAVGNETARALMRMCADLLNGDEFAALAELEALADRRRIVSKELRAPDPTLTALLDSGGETRVVCSDDTSVRGGMVAHRPGGHLSERVHVDRFPSTACGLQWVGFGYRMQARHARWHAVPCRECFPDAPIPGQGWALGWQVQP